MTKISNQYSLTNILTADLANSRLGINNVSPTVALDVTGAGKFSGVSTFLTTVTLGTGTASGGLLRINQPTNDILGGIVCQSNGGANGGMFHNTTSLVYHNSNDTSKLNSTSIDLERELLLELQVDQNLCEPGYYCTGF